MNQWLMENEHQHLLMDLKYSDKPMMENFLEYNKELQCFRSSSCRHWFQVFSRNWIWSLQEMIHNECPETTNKIKKLTINNEK